MSILHPGGTSLTDSMLDMCSLLPGQALLDLGCGYGDTAAHISKKYEVTVIGAEVNDKMLAAARSAHPELAFVKCDGQTLDFDSHTFDCALMECSFSLMPRQEELLHELYCVLKPGGRLAISDLYMLHPDMERAKKNCIEAQKLIYHQRKDGECTEEQVFPSPFCLDGMFVKELLLALLEDTGFTLEIWCDKTQDLRNWAAQLLMDHGSFDAAAAALMPEGVDCSSFCRVSPGKQTGYFTMVARRE